MTIPTSADAMPSVAPTAGDVRLRRPDRSQVTMRVGCDDDLIPAGHAARTIWSVVGSLDLSAFHNSIKARDSVAGRDGATRTPRGAGRSCGCAAA